MYIDTFSTFPNDCRILANLFMQARITIYFTEDTDIEKAAALLKIPVRVRIVGEASRLHDFEIRRFFREKFKEKRKAFHTSRKHH